MAKHNRCVPEAPTGANPQVDRGGFAPGGAPANLDLHSDSEGPGKQLSAFGGLSAKKSTTVKSTGSGMDTTAVSRVGEIKAPNKHA